MSSYARTRSATTGVLQKVAIQLPCGGGSDRIAHIKPSPQPRELPSPTSNYCPVRWLTDRKPINHTSATASPDLTLSDGLRQSLSVSF